jgi:hypothetical protein
MENGAVKYGDRNWELGQPLSTYIDSAERHIASFKEGMRDEDHLAAARWNLGCVIHTEEMIRRGLLPKELNDLPSYLPNPTPPAVCAPAQASEGPKQTVAYILGPMTGMHEEGRPAFRAAAASLRARGYEVISPDELDKDNPVQSKTWNDYMKRDIPYLLKADIGVALPGWKSSKGAILEATILHQFNKPVFAYLMGGDLSLIGAAELPIPATL